MRERTDRAERGPVRQAICGGRRSNLAHIRPPVLVIIARHHSSDGIDRKRAGQAHRVTDVAFVVIATRTLMVRAHTQICVHADRELLCTTQMKWQFCVQNNPVIGKEFVAQAVAEGQPIKIVPRAQH